MVYQTGKVNIGRVIRDAVLFDPKQGLERSMNADSLLDAVNHLFALLNARRIDYLLVGGVAVLSYIEGRNTEDLDLIMAGSGLEQLPEIKLARRDLWFAGGDFEGLKIDILLADNPLFEKVSRVYATTRSFQEQDVPTATVEGLLLLKLYALPSLYRQGDFSRVGLYENDIAGLLYAYRPELPPLLAELAQFVTGGDLVEIKRILAEIQQRIEQFRKKTSPDTL